MFQSPLKTVAEKIKPVDSKSSISSLKFERSSDFKKFIRFIKDETEQLEKIKLPSVTEVKPKSKAPSALGLFGLGFITLLTSAFGGGDGKDDKFRIGGAPAGSINTLVPGGFGMLKPKAKDIGGAATQTTKFKKNIKLSERDKKRKRITVKKRQRELLRRNRRINEEFQRRKRVVQATYVDIEKIELNKMREFEKLIDPTKEFSDAKLKKMYFDTYGENLEDVLKERTIKKVRNIFKIGDIDDASIRRQVAADIAEADLLTRIGKPTSLEEAKLLERIANQKENIKGGVDEFGTFYPDAEVVQDAKFARQALKDPEVQKLLKEDKFKNITGDATPEARSFFKGKFTPKYALDDLFTSVGKNTKGFRDFMSRPFMKGQKPTGLGKALMPAMGLGGKLLRGGGIGLDAVGFIFQAADLIDGFIVGDNIFTAFYDLGVAFHNLIEPDKTKLKFFITKSRNKEKNAFIDKKNQKVLEAIQKAQKAKGISDQVLANTRDQQRGGIIPSVKTAVSNPFGITLAPTVFGIKFISEKLYRQ
tara:strand:- start:1379 stop:2977 length:1599 start_codon:yes stop_codon:yes gene_type:complete